MSKLSEPSATQQGNLFVISGPSGSGKGTLISRLITFVPSAWLSVSATTRAPRAGEVEGVNYYFMTREEFDALVVNNGLLEYATYAGNSYGTPRSSVEKHMAAGRQVILEIECQGAFQVREKMPEAHLIFIEPPTLAELERRLRGRGTEDEAKIIERLQTARVELEHKMEYDVRIVNDNLDVATKKLVEYINSVIEGGA